MKVRARASSGEEVATDLTVERIESRHSMIYHLAAKALMDDLEAGNSWLHDKMHRVYGDGTPDELDEAVRREAERLGNEWSVFSKWTSFVAVDDENQVQNVTRTYRAEESDLFELTRPRLGGQLLSSPMAPARGRRKRKLLSHGGTTDVSYSLRPHLLLKDNLEIVRVLTPYSETLAMSLCRPRTLVPV